MYVYKFWKVHTHRGVNTNTEIDIQTFTPCVPAAARAESG